MTGSMYAAIAGLQTHMQKMNVIGNNIANANTAGFKPGVTTFTESMYTSLKTSTAGGDTMGGTNAAQIGYGSQLCTIDISMSAGTPAPTNVNSHLYLNGSGIFLVGPKPTMPAEGEEATEATNGAQMDPNQLILKRVGNFNLDEDGYLVDAAGNCVYGFMPLAASEDTEGEMSDAAGAATNKVNKDIIWDTYLRPIRIPVAAPAPDANGGLAEGSAIYPTLGDSGELDYGDDMDTENRVKLESVDLSFDNNGVITAVTKDGEAITIGAIAIGSVRNPNGLTKEAEGYYRAGGNSGDVTVGVAGGVLGDRYLNVAPGEDAPDGADAIDAGGETKILSNYLESSKTDISTEFADLITTQRGFQANTKIITVTDEMLSDLVSMKR